MILGGGGGVQGHVEFSLYLNMVSEKKAVIWTSYSLLVPLSSQEI